MTWTDSMKLGIPDIDRQHQELCMMADDFYDACAQGRGTEEVLRLLEFLAEYTERHFNEEEKLQLEIHYPHYERHKAQHDDMRRRVSALKQEVAAWGAATPMVKTVNETITAWLIRHIMGFDADLRQYIK